MVPRWWCRHARDGGGAHRRRTTFVVRQRRRRRYAERARTPSTPSRRCLTGYAGSSAVCPAPGRHVVAAAAGCRLRSAVGCDRRRRGASDCVIGLAVAPTVRGHRWTCVNWRVVGVRGRRRRRRRRCCGDAARAKRVVPRYSSTVH